MYLITGSHGQLGTELSKLLPQAILTDRETLDITNESVIMPIINKNFFAF